ncbi:alpha/beta hydrolase family protein [Rhizoctonia solani]|uniref:Alpha/beta hydrolase family protein n=1 Tax=Rhizoctonia solani TaxID=456999 RepID=A0A8H8NZ20_9AGAM|nr:alpha/beta hydrolase family protein [Rhizoctonia solani]QRW22579.1 alpha/beta hydrolase family protein [Rhizoctonia solani]
MRILNYVLIATFYRYSLSATALYPIEEQSSIENHWVAYISHAFEVIGPFPQEAREQHFLNPGYPLKSEIVFPLDYTHAYTSHLADNGFVHWTNHTAAIARASSGDSDHKKLESIHYSIQFPGIRWDSIRHTEGWSGLQHHALLHTTIRLTSALSHNPLSLSRPTYLVLTASQCSYIAILNSRHGSLNPRWHACNIYDTDDMPPVRVPLKAYFDHEAVKISATDFAINGMELDVLISLDYEIRLFGDPTVSSDGTTPVVEVDISVKVEQTGDQDVPDIDNNALDSPSLEPNQLRLSNAQVNPHTPCMQFNAKTHVFPHFIDGWAYGDAAGIEVTSCSEEYWSIGGTPRFIDTWVTDEIRVEMIEPIRLAPSQTRLVSMNLVQEKPLLAPAGFLTLELSLHLDIHSSRTPHKLLITIPIQNHPSLCELSEDTEGLLLTYRSVSGTPASAVVIPPPNKTHNITTQSRILLALHGAGVLVVQGLTPWGLDWREASRADVCAALRALVLKLVGVWHEDDYCTAHDLATEITVPKPPGVPVKTIPVVAIGHSNGGQGALHLTSAFPDCIPALIPAAGYTSARLYVPTQASRGSLFADAALQSILRASLQGQDGDIIAGNLALSRVHLVHGGSDENVPVWHSRERMALIKMWNPDADVNMTEIPGKPHFWDTVFKEKPVSNAIQDLVSSPYAASNTIETDFTLTVAWPSESGSMRGWRIRKAKVPGRLSRIHVSGSSIQTTNVHTFSVELSKSQLKDGDVIEVDSQRIKVPRQSSFWLSYEKDNQWEIVHTAKSYHYGSLSSALTSAMPIALVIPAREGDYYQTIALRIAHSLYTYLKLDCTILRDSELQGRVLEGRSVVVIGGHHNKYGMAVRSSPLRILPDGSIVIGQKRYNINGVGALSFHKDHVYMDALDLSGYERILRAFPLRTGVPGPEWMIIGPESNTKGFGGILATG